MDQGQTPVNPYAPAGAPYAPGSNTPPPTFATPAVPNTAADPAYTSFSTSSSPVFTPDQPPQKERFFSKKFIVFASVGLALIVAAIVTGVILQNNRNNGTSDVTQQISSSVAVDTNISSDDAVKKISNIFISGEDSTNSPDFSVDAVFYVTDISKNDSTSEDKEQFGKTLNTYARLQVLDQEISRPLLVYSEYILIDYYLSLMSQAFRDGGAENAKSFISAVIPVNTDSVQTEYGRLEQKIRLLLEQGLAVLVQGKAGGCDMGQGIYSNCDKNVASLAAFNSTRESIDISAEALLADLIGKLEQKSGGTA